MKKRVYKIAALLMLVGCATGPQFEDYAGHDASCIEGDLPNILTAFFEERDAPVNILEIDGVPTCIDRRVTHGPYCLSPGTHVLRVGVVTDDPRAGQPAADLSLSFNFDPGRKYKLKARRKHAYVFELKRLDVTAGQEIQVDKPRVFIFD